MKSFAILAGVAALLLCSSLATLASSHASKAGVTYQVRLLLPSRAHGQFTLRSGLGLIPLDTAATGTPTPTAATVTPTAAPTTPTPTPTVGPSYPDAQTVLSNMAQVLALVRTIHFQQIATRKGPVNLNITGTGDATCTGPALMAHVKASASVAGTAQNQKIEFYLIQVKSQFFRRAKATHNTWQLTKAKNVQPFGFVVQNPLICPSTTTGGGGSGTPSDTIKDLTNLGPDTRNGVSVWHIHAVDVQVDSAGAVIQLPLDWYIDQTHNLLESFVQTFTDDVHGFTDTLTLNLSKFGEKLKIKKPAIGSSRP